MELLTYHYLSLEDGGFNALQFPYRESILGLTHVSGRSHPLSSKDLQSPIIMSVEFLNQAGIFTLAFGKNSCCHS